MNFEGSSVPRVGKHSKRIWKAWNREKWLRERRDMKVQHIVDRYLLSRSISSNAPDNLGLRSNLKFHARCLRLPLCVLPQWFRKSVLILLTFWSLPSGLGSSNLDDVRCVPSYLWVLQLLWTVTSFKTLSSNPFRRTKQDTTSVWMKLPFLIRQPRDNQRKFFEARYSPNHSINWLIELWNKE